MKCPYCGEEISEVLERGNRLVGYEAVWKETIDNDFVFFNEVRGDTADSQTDEVVCPKCEKALKYKIEKGRMMIETGV